MECICLAGGLGTRLRPVLPDLPKCLAPVGGRPFLDRLLASLRSRGVSRVVLSLGHLHEAIVAHIRDRDYGLWVDCVVEPEPLGTAGAIRLALSGVRSEHVLVVNADTWYEADAGALFSHHLRHGADVTMALKPMADAGRYGRVEFRDGRVTGFVEKGSSLGGLINGGVYVVRRDIGLPAHGSFENDYLAVPGPRVCGLVQDLPFLDIGVPDDYRRAVEVPGLLEGGA